MNPRMNNLIFIFLFKILMVESSYKTYFSMRVDYFEMCPDRKTPNRVENINLIQVNRDKILVNMELVIEKVSPKLPAVMVIEKCTSRGDEQCEQFMRIVQPDFCHIFTEKGQFWTVFYESVTPKLSCPVKEGRYVARNSSIDFMLLMKNIPTIGDVDTYYWKFSTDISSTEKEELLCVRGGGKLEKFRKKM